MAKMIFKGRLLNVLKKKVLLPNGNKVELEIVKHPGAALVVPFIGNDKIVFIKQFRPVIDDYLYELPAGTLNVNEDITVCAKRELKEETGFIAGKIKKLGEIVLVPGYSTEKIFIFKAQGLKKVDCRNEPDEVIEVEFMSKLKIRGLFKAGKIIDAKTICALAMCGVL